MPRPPDPGETTGERAIATAARLERQLKVAQEITHIGSWEWDLGSATVTWSDELYRIYGLVPRSREITFEVFLSMVHPDDRRRVADEIGGALARGGGRFAHRERIVRPDGTVRDLDTLGEVLVDKAGRPTGLIGTCRDITEERRREEQIRIFADIVDNVQIGLSVWRLDTPGDPAALRLVAWNPAFEEATGVSLTGAGGRSLGAVFPSTTGTALPALMVQVDERSRVRELAAYRFAEAPRGRDLAVKVFALPDHCVGLALEDVSTRVRAQRLQAGERRVLELLASSAALGEIFVAIVEMIEELEPDTLASVLLLDPTGTRLVHGAAPRLPDAYNRAIDGAQIGPTAGSCGTAAYRRAPVLVEDIETDPLWADYRDLARPYGLRACWSHPIVASDGRVLGTFALYYREPRRPDAQALEMIARAAHVAGMVIERRRLDDQLRALSARIEAIREDERTGIAREIHDELGQAMTVLKMDLAWVQRRVGDPAAVSAKLDEMSRSADQVIAAVRRISAELRPGILDDLGLVAAIEWQAEEWQRRTQIR
jgi:PAS domain S-box-containing protein